MRFSTLLVAGTMLAGLAGAAAPASATICPVIGVSAGACDLVFTFNANGSVTTSGAGGSSIGGEDALIGVVNNTTHTLNSFVLTGSGIYGFDGDGIDFYTGIGPVPGNPDTTTYGGPDGFFTNIVGNTGTVNFFGGIPAGGTNYFSLENAVSLTAPPVVGVPEPASMAILGAGLIALGATGFRRKT